jgi:hypothetical protein
MIKSYNEIKLIHVCTNSLLNNYFPAFIRHFNIFRVHVIIKEIIIFEFL